MTEDEALRIVMPLTRDEQKLLLQVLINEMHSRDLINILENNGFVLVE